MANYGDYQLNNFGKATTNYSIGELRRLVSTGLLEEAKLYILKYFIKLSSGDFIVWVASKNATDRYTEAIIAKTHIPKSISSGQWKIQQWFFNDLDVVFEYMSDITQPKLFLKNGGYHINVFEGFKWVQPLKWSNLDKYLRKSVEKVWKHIEEVWCSGNSTLFDYVKNWLCHSISGRKMNTVLYLKSGQGTGKSIITEFIQNHVLGHDCVLITPDANIINPDSFNSSLKTCTMVVFEEVNTTTKREWENFSNNLKHVVTGSTITIKTKFEHSLTVKNNISFICVTNKSPIKVELGDRRTVALDISDSKVGNFTYFQAFADECINDEVGEAFYWYCRKHAKKNADFKENKLPHTETKKEMQIENLPSLFTFIKETYVLHNKGIDTKFSNFYTEFCAYLEIHKRSKVSNIRVSKYLTEAKIPIVAKADNKKFVCIQSKDLLAIYKEKKWIHDIDEFDEEIIGNPPKEGIAKQKEKKQKLKNTDEAIISFFD